MSRAAVAVALSLACCLAAGCADPPRPRGVSVPGGFPPLAEGGQLPVDVVQVASDRHGGSMEQATPGVGGVPAVGRGVVLGPITAEQVPPHVDPPSGDAGRAIREAVAGGVSGSAALQLIDAPDERLVDDAPRPDLARRGVRWVVKGVVRYRDDGAEATVFLRAVDTATGNVGVVASGRSPRAEEAADQAARRLVARLEGAAP